MLPLCAALPCCQTRATNLSDFDLLMSYESECETASLTLRRTNGGPHTGLLDEHMGMLEAMDAVARTEDAFRHADTVYLLLQRCSVMSPAFQAAVVTFMKHTLKQLATVRCIFNPRGLDAGWLVQSSPGARSSQLLHRAR